MSDKDCRNDCSAPLRFPRRPGTDTPSSHGESCPCCSSAGRTSQDNRPALAHFNYRIGTYGSIREFLFHRIDQTSEFLNWTHRTPDDPAVALMEGAAILGDILTFYQDTYANEAFLRTARWRESVADLVRLLGYRMSPAVGGKTTFAFEIKKDEPVVIPAGFPVKATLEDIAKPVEFETTTKITAYPWLSRFNLFAPLVETLRSDEFEIRVPKASEMSVEIKSGDRLLVGESEVSQPSSLANAEILIVDSIRERQGAKIFKLKGGTRSWPDTSRRRVNVFAYRIGRTFHHFGYNSPAQVTDPDEPVKTVVKVKSATESETTSTVNVLPVPFTRSVIENNPGSKITSPLGKNDFPFDMEVKDIPANVPILVQARFFSTQKGKATDARTLIRTISKIDPVKMLWGGISGTVSRITLPSLNAEPAAERSEEMIRAKAVSSTGDAFGGRVEEVEDAKVSERSDRGEYAGSWYVGDGKVTNDVSIFIDDALFHEITSPRLTIKAARIEPGSGEREIKLNFYGTAEQASSLKNRRIMLEKKGAETRIVKITGVSSARDEDISTITLAEPVRYADYPYENPAVTVFGNLVEADEGKTVPEAAIGDGDATQIFQNFKLPKAPLTYHIVAANTPTETPELEIYVNGRLWSLVDSFFGHKPDENIYIVREDTDGNSWVQFGDGKTGARLTSGSKNVTARFRIGDGAFGPLKADTKVQASAKLKNLDKIQMPTDVSGGSAPEDTENARNTAPGKVQSLGRIVSLNDFEFEAMAIPGVALASAAWKLVDSLPGVVVSVLMETGRGTEIDAVRSTLGSYNAERGAGRNALQIDQGQRKYTAVKVEYALKPTYRADVVESAIRLALGVNYGKLTGEEDQTGLFSLRRRRFGAAEYASSIEGWVQNVEGVLCAKTTVFDELEIPDDPGAFASLTSWVLSPVIACDPGYILSLYNDHLSLKLVAEVGG